MRGAGAAVVVLVATTLGAVVAIGCSSDGERAAGARTDGSELVVSAASSLTDVLGVLSDRFESEHPGTTVLLNLDSSSLLAAQVLAGAPVDVFASADPENMDELVAARAVDGTPEVFATNELVIVTRPGNPTRVAGPGDLSEITRSGEVVALCAADAPCGRLAGRVLDAAGVPLPEDRVTRAPNARATLGAVRRGDAAAALVYATDAGAAGSEVATVPLGAGVAASTDYVVAVLDQGDGDRSAAREFVDLVTSQEGREVLAGEGFR